MLQPHIRIMLIDYDGNSLALYSEQFRRIPWLDFTGHATDVKSAVCEAHRTKPNIVVLSVSVPFLDAVFIMRGIYRAIPERPPVFFRLMRSAAQELTLDAEIEAIRMLYTTTSALLGEASMPCIVRTAELELEVRVTKELQWLGIPASMIGFKYLRWAVTIAVDNPMAANAVTKDIYPEVARHFTTKYGRVERAMNTAIARCDPSALRACFGPLLRNGKTRPTNAEFIATLAERIRLQMENNLIA